MQSFIGRLALRLLAIACLATLLARPAAASLVTFDDLLGGGIADSQLASPYAGLTWSNFYVLDTAVYTAQNGPSGYVNGVRNPANVAFTGFGNAARFASSQPFTLNSYYVGAGWNDGLSVTVQGLLDGIVMDTATFTVSTQGSILEQPHWSNIDSVLISSSGGTNAGYRGDGTQVYLDSIDISIPEPDSLALLALGIAGMGLLCGRPTRPRSSVRTGIKKFI